MELIDRAKKVMGNQFNRLAWEEWIKQDKKEVEKKLKELEKIRK